MTKDEALKLALEALEASHFLIHGSETKGGLAFCMDGYYSGCFDIDSNDKQTNEAITAIKEALAQPEQEQLMSDQINYGMSVTQGGKRIDPMSIYKEPEQEPVAQCTESDSWNCKYCRKTESCKALQDPRNFTTPPQRKPLTDEEERKAFEQWYVCNAFDYERNPIGSRECGLQWSAWKARAAHGIKGEA